MSSPDNVSRTLSLKFAIGVVIWVFASSGARAEDPLTAAKSARDPSAKREILGAAVRESPNRADYWLDLIESFDRQRERFRALCVCRTALALNPDSPELIMAHARLLESSVAIDALTPLKRIHGHEEDASDWQAMLSLGLRLPYSGFDKPYDSWTAQLITRGDWKQADEVVKRGLRQ